MMTIGNSCGQGVTQCSTDARDVSQQAFHARIKPCTLSMHRIALALCPAQGCSVQRPIHVARCGERPTHGIVYAPHPQRQWRQDYCLTPPRL
jgi:hypothetical protein